MSKVILGDSFLSSVTDIVYSAISEGVRMYGLDQSNLSELIAQRIIEGPLDTFDD